jgi:hypothetical protein
MLYAMLAYNIRVSCQSPDASSLFVVQSLANLADRIRLATVGYCTKRVVKRETYGIRSCTERGRKVAILAATLVLPKCL